MRGNRYDARAPAFQFYPRDWDTDINVIPMTLEEEGVYWSLCRIYWLNGWLPTDLDALRALLKGHPSRAQMERWWKHLAACFQRNGDTLTHRRLDRERKKQQAWRQKCAKGGRKSAETRAGRGVKGSSTTLQRVVEQHHEGLLKDRATLQFASASADQDQNQDQDPRPAAGERPVENVEKLKPHRPLESNPSLIAKFVHDLRDARDYDADQASLKEDVKRLCGQRGVRYDADAVTKALDTVERTRARRAGLVSA